MFHLSNAKLRIVVRSADFAKPPTTRRAFGTPRSIAEAICKWIIRLDASIRAVMIADSFGVLLAHEVVATSWSEPVLPEEYSMAFPFPDYGIVVYLRAAVGKSPERMRAMVEGLFTPQS